MSTKREGVPEFDKADLDEPVFVLRAQDDLAPEVVQLWALNATMRGAPKSKVEDARRCAREMRDWQRAHGSKIPD
jgi:hypothetical protein